MIADRAQAENMLTQALRQLFAVAENYPNLKADAQFQTLSSELAGTQNRIAVARGRFVDAVKTYNNAVQTFPGNIFAGMFGFAPSKEYFKAQQGAMTTPKVFG